MDKPYVNYSDIDYYDLHTYQEAQLLEIAILEQDEAIYELRYTDYEHFINECKDLHEAEVVAFSFLRYLRNYGPYNLLEKHHDYNYISWKNWFSELYYGHLPYNNDEELNRLKLLLSLIKNQRETTLKWKQMVHDNEVRREKEYKELEKKTRNEEFGCTLFILIVVSVITYAIYKLFL